RTDRYHRVHPLCRCGTRTDASQAGARTVVESRVITGVARLSVAAGPGAADRTSGYHDWIQEWREMSERFAPRIGAVFSADIAVPEHEREVSFYSRVLHTGEDPLWRDDLMSNLGVPIIGLGPQSPEYGDLPLQWMPHIQ